MNFRNRSHVEATGRFGAATERDDRGLRAKQLNSFWLYVDEEDSGYTKHAIGDGFWEAWITLWMDRNVKQGSTCIDIGANHGYYSFFLANKGGRVFAAEPQPKLQDLIVKSEEVNQSGITVITSAISDTVDETISMMVPIHHGMNATISNEHSYAPDGFEHIDVRTTTIDALYRLYGSFDFIKVDAEGAEDLIWAGSENFRRENPDCLWLMEWRWDRYKNPEEFAGRLLSDYRVSNVEYDGGESDISSVEQVASRQHEDWMFVLRPKS